MITRTATMLAALLLTVSQPLMAACQCAGCAGQGDADRAAAATQKSCCSRASAPSSCCQSTAGQPCCDSCDGSGGSSAEGCLCSAQPNLTAVTASTVQVDLSSDVHAWLVGSSIAAVRGPQSSDCVAGLAHAPPPRCGNLRLHAFLGVWLI